MCRPASVSTNCCGRRSNKVTPRKFSRTMTWRLTALWATVRLLAAAVKLICCPAASKARSALSGSHLRSIVFPLKTTRRGREYSNLSDARVREPLLGNFIAHLGPARQHDISVRADLQGFGRHVVVAIHIFRRIEREKRRDRETRKVHSSTISGPDGLEVHIFLDGVRRAVAAEARLLEAAERRRH